MTKRRRAPPRHKQQGRALHVTGNAASGGGAQEKATVGKHTDLAPPPQPFVDKYGNPHSAAVMRNWTPAARAALGIRRVEEGGQ